MIESLLDRAGGDPRRAEKGIVFVDEIDKIRRGWTGGRDISGEGVQNALLTLLDGRRSEGHEGSRRAAVDTSRLLFVCSGAFVGLDGIVERRLGAGRSGMGFVARDLEAEVAAVAQPVYQALCQVDTADLVEFGMIPEFVGRFATITPLHELGRTDLRRILAGGIEMGALERQRRLAAIHGIELEFTEAALEAIVEEAEALGTGARGLHRLVGRAVDAVDHRWPELARAGVRRVRIGADCLTSGTEVEIEHGAPELEPCDDELRRISLSGLPPAPGGMRTAVKDERAPSKRPEQLRSEFESMKSGPLDYSAATSTVRAWWDRFEADNGGQLELLHRLATELVGREATVSDLFDAYLYSDTRDLQANLHYLDYLMIKRRASSDGG